jgi:SAM-dependent methyltransferase
MVELRSSVVVQSDDISAAQGYSYRDSHKYDSKGAEYEAFYQMQPWPRFVWAREQKILLTILEKYFAGKDVHLLDFACGTGRIAGLLENRVKTSTGVDVSGSMLSIARQKLQRTEIIEADITVDGVLDGRKFNLITAFRFFLNAEPELRKVAMKTLVPLLADDGYLVFNNHQNRDCAWVRLLIAYRQWRKIGGIYNTMSVCEMRQLVEDAGLEIIELYPVGFFHPPKIPVSCGLNWVIDETLGRFGFLARFCESPIAVCHRRGGHKAAQVNA